MTGVVITAWSALTPFGHGRAAFADGVRAGRPVDPVSTTDEWGTAEACLVPDFDIVEQLGNENFIYLLNGSTLLTARMAPDLRVQRGDRIDVSVLPENLHFFDPQTEQAIR